MAPQHSLVRDGLQFTAGNDHAAFDDQRVDRRRRAEEQGRNGVGGAAIPGRPEVEQGDIGAFAGFEAAEVAAAQALRAAKRCHAEGLHDREGGSAVAQPLQQ